MKALLREAYNAITDAALVFALCLIVGTCVGIFLGTTFAVGFIVFNILMEVLL